jgi:hypothetical protein
MSQKKKKKNKEQEMLESMSKPWIQKRTGFIAITVLSIALMIFISVQLIIQNPEEWPKAILWGFLFGASVWVVFFGFNWFHSLFRSKPEEEKKA